MFPLLGVRSHTRSAYVHARRLTSRPVCTSHSPTPQRRSGAVSEGSAVTKPSMSHCVETRERSRPSDSRCGGSACSCGCDATRASSVRVSASTPVSCAVKYDGSSRSMTHSSSQKAAWRDGEKRGADHALEQPKGRLCARRSCGEAPSPYLPISPAARGRTQGAKGEMISPYLPISPHIIPYLPISPNISQGKAASSRPKLRAISGNLA